MQSIKVRLRWCGRVSVVGQHVTMIEIKQQLDELQTHISKEMDDARTNRFFFQIKQGQKGVLRSPQPRQRTALYTDNLPCNSVLSVRISPSLSTALHWTNMCTFAHLLAYRFTFSRRRPCSSVKSGSRPSTGWIVAPDVDSGCRVSDCEVPFTL